MPVLRLVDPETEVSANREKIVQIQNILENWLRLVQSRADLLGSEEFQDFLDLSRPGSVELRMSKHVLFSLI